MTYPDSLDPTKPSDANYLREGDDRIRETRAAIRERLLTIFTDPDADPLVFIAGIINGAALADNAVSAAKLADNAVDTAAIIDGAVTDVKIANVNGSKLADSTVATAKIPDGAIVTSKLASGAVSIDKIQDDAVSGSKIADGGIANSKLIDDTLTGSKLAVALRQILVKQQHTDFAVATFSLATNTIWDSPDVAIPGITEFDSLIVSVESAAAGWAAAMKLVTFYAYVAAAGIAKLRLQNNSGGPATVPNSNWRILALRRYSDWYP